MLASPLGIGPAFLGGSLLIPSDNNTSDAEDNNNKAGDGDDDGDEDKDGSEDDDNENDKDSDVEDDDGSMAGLLVFSTYGSRATKGCVPYDSAHRQLTMINNLLTEELGLDYLDIRLANLLVDEVGTLKLIDLQRVRPTTDYSSTRFVDTLIKL